MAHTGGYSSQICCIAADTLDVAHGTAAEVVDAGLCASWNL